jgi:hypothetical protein
MAEGSNGKRLFIEGGSLDSLLGLISGLTDAQSSLIVQARTGEWAQVTGSVINVSSNPDNVAVSIHLEGRHDVFMIFEKRSIEAMVLCKNDEITVQGQIAAHMGGISLTNCEIITHKTGLELLVRQLEAEAAEPKPDAPKDTGGGAKEEPLARRIEGRPPKAWWDDLWVEMCRQLYEGDLKPVRQADIEKAMHAWLNANDHEASEMTVRTRARKLFAAIKPEG